MYLNLTEYHEKAHPITAHFDDQMLVMSPKKFSTGSVGWYANGKCKILVGDTYYPVQVSLTVTIIGSKISACPQTSPDAPESDDLPLIGPEYPYNRSEQEGAIQGQEMPSGIETASHNGQQLLRKRPRKERKK